MEFSAFGVNLESPVINENANEQTKYYSTLFFNRYVQIKLGIAL